jgi:hypothetical protein
MARNFGVPMPECFNIHRSPPDKRNCALALDFAMIRRPAILEQAYRMIKRGLFAVLVFAAPVCPASAQDTKVSVEMMGIGGMSCAHWRSTQEHRLEGTIWIYGFWTGLNYVAAASDQRQPRIDATAIVAEVENTCAQQTLKTLASAVWATYLESKR